MKKRKLKKYVLPTVYLFTSISILLMIILLRTNYVLDDVDYDYSVDIMNNHVNTVSKEDEVLSKNINKPVEDDLKVEIGSNYYSYLDNEEDQKKSLIFFDNTYMPNTGIFYISDEEFNVISVYEGKVTDIKEDEFFGKVIEVTHNNNLKTYYYGLDKIEVSKDDEITASTILGVSKNNKIMPNKKSFLFESYYNNKLIDPENIFGKTINEYE